MTKPEPSDLLQDMRLVFNSKQRKGETEAQLALRADRKRAPALWLKEYRANEKEYRDEIRTWEKECRKNGDGLPETVTDEGSLKAEELIDRLLAEYRAQKKRA